MMSPLRTRSPLSFATATPHPAAAAPPTVTATTPAVAAPVIAPGIGLTIYGDLPRDIDRARDAIRECDFVCLHTAAGPEDVRNAALVRQLGCARVWLAIPANYLVGLAQRKGIDAAVREAERVAKVALDMGAEVLEINGEGQSDGQKPGDWIPADPNEAVRLARLAVALLETLRAELKGRCALSWTSHDMPSFRLPWGEILTHVDLHAPQHYPSQRPYVSTQRALEQRVSVSRGRWEGLAERGVIHDDVAPHGARWTMYTQGWGQTTGAMVWGLCEATTARLWAFPSSWDANALDALRAAKAIRAECGFGPDAVEKWQTAHGLEPDGIIGKNTLKALGIGR